jgi:hypothetical protein
MKIVDSDKERKMADIDEEIEKLRIVSMSMRTSGPLIIRAHTVKLD